MADGFDRFAMLHTCSQLHPWDGRLACQSCHRLGMLKLPALLRLIAVHHNYSNKCSGNSATMDSNSARVLPSNGVLAITFALEHPSRCCVCLWSK